MSKRVVVLSELALLMAGLFWGSGYAVVKDSLDVLSANWSMMIRFTISAALMFAVFFKKVQFHKEMILMGAVSGLCLYLSTGLQTVALGMTSAGNTSFLTVTYVVWVPFVYWIIEKQRPKMSQLLACVLCMVGVGFIALQGDFRIHKGDAIVLVCAVFAACQVVSIGIGTNRYKLEPISLSCWQFLFTAVFGLIAALLFDPPLPVQQIVSSGRTIASLLYSAICGGMLAFLMQSLGMEHAPVSHASLLLATEAPFGCLFGILLLDERLTLRTLIGFLIILGTIVYSEVMKNRAQLKEATVSEASQ